MAVKRAAKLAIVLFGLIAVGLTTITTITSSEEVFADKKGSKKNQKTDQKIDCAQLTITESFQLTLQSLFH